MDAYMFDYEDAIELTEFAERIEEMLRQKQYAQLRDLLLPLEAADIALVMMESEDSVLPLVFRGTTQEKTAGLYNVGYDGLGRYLFHNAGLETAAS